MTPFQHQRITSISLSIRKLQRGLRVAYHQQVAPESNWSWKIEEIMRLKDELETLTGSRAPSSPKWPL